MRYQRPKSGEWIQPVSRGYKMMCCDCGLVHKMNFRIAISKGGKFLKVQFQARRDERATAATRRAYESIKVIKAKKR